MKILLLLPLLLGFSVPATAHNIFNGGDAMHRSDNPFGGEPDVESEEGEEGENTMSDPCEPDDYNCDAM